VGVQAVARAAARSRATTASRRLGMADDLRVRLI
jgi:hypothetical protein